MTNEKQRSLYSHEWRGSIPARGFRRKKKCLAKPPNYHITILPLYQIMSLPCYHIFSMLNVLHMYQEALRTQAHRSTSKAQSRIEGADQEAGKYGSIYADKKISIIMANP